jgi:insertion element IS1 protein InsB
MSIGDRSERSCIELWKRVPECLKRGITYSDFWKPYAKIIQSLRHESVGKETGQTNYMKRCLPAGSYGLYTNIELKKELSL